MSAPTVDQKVVATLQAKYAMAGFELRPQADGSLVVGRWGYWRDLRTVEAAETFLHRVTLRGDEVHHDH